MSLKSIVRMVIQMETVEKLKEVLKCIVEHIRPDGEFHYFTYAEVEEMKNYLKSEKIKDGTVEVVIRLPEKTYRKILSNEYDYGDMNVIIQTGTVLPKGHGRLIDVENAKTKLCRVADRVPEPSKSCYIMSALYLDNTDEFPTAIEADREVDNG